MIRSDFPKTSGQVTITIRNRDGKVIDRYTVPNTILNSAREHMARLSAGEDTEARRVQKLWLGTGGIAGGDPNDPIAPSPGDLWLDEPIADTVSTPNPIEIVTYSFPTSRRVLFEATIPLDEYNGVTITEVLLAGAGTNAWARDTFKGIPKNDYIAIDFNWEIIF